jgi:hypothetical protein
MTEIAENIGQIRERIVAATMRSNRNPESVSLVAVSKRVLPDRIAEAYSAGIRSFGESYLQEALPKIGCAALNLAGMEWHFIGRLQSNKVRDVVAHFTLIQSVDSRKMALEIGRRAAEAGRIARILLEVKLDTVGTKIGIEPDKAHEEALGISEIPGIRLEGLMGIAPYVTAAEAGAGAEASRPAFRRLAELFCRLPETCRQTLSMGMTGDFEIAIEEGATLVRIGTGVFGTRT